MTFTQRMAAYSDRYQKLQMTLVRLEESAKQKRKEAAEAVDVVERVLGTRDFNIAEQKVKEHYERLNNAFQNLDKALKECEDLYDQIMVGVDADIL